MFPSFRAPETMTAVEQARILRVTMSHDVPRFSGGDGRSFLQDPQTPGGFLLAAVDPERPPGESALADGPNPGLGVLILWHPAEPIYILTASLVRARMSFLPPNKSCYVCFFHVGSRR
jgi:hypothetical protein